MAPLLPAVPSCCIPQRLLLPNECRVLTIAKEGVVRQHRPLPHRWPSSPVTPRVHCPWLLFPSHPAPLVCPPVATRQHAIRFKASRVWELAAPRAVQPLSCSAKCITIWYTEDVSFASKGVKPSIILNSSSSPRRGTINCLRTQLPLPHMPRLACVGSAAPACPLLLLLLLQLGPTVGARRRLLPPPSHFCTTSVGQMLPGCATRLLQVLPSPACRPAAIGASRGSSSL